MHTYDETRDSTRAASIIFPFLKEILRSPDSVIDVGCGIGNWLYFFESQGITDVLGLDGEHVLKTNLLMLSGEKFVPCDLRFVEFNNLGRKFDWCLCLEVAEHVPEEYGDNLIKFLCSISDIIIFSAAIPGQTGENHLNEQYPDYWQNKFKNYGYSFYDVFRPKFWENTEIDWWYRQNMFLVLKDSSASNYNFPLWDGKLYIIKELFEEYTRALNSRNSSDLISPMLKKSLSCLPIFLKNKLKNYFTKPVR